MAVAITFVTRSTSLDNERGQRLTAEQRHHTTVGVAAALKLLVRTSMSMAPARHVAATRSVRLDIRGKILRRAYAADISMKALPCRP